MKIELPDIDAILKMIDLFSKKKHNLSEKEKYEFAIATEGLSGANIEEIITKAIRNAVINNKPINKQGFYEELFLFKGIIPQNYENEKQLLRIKSQFLREINKKVFSLQRIADILGSSKSTISKLIKEDE